MGFESFKNESDLHIMGTYSRFPVCIVEGKGAVAISDDGREYIDFGSGIGVNSLGYCDKDWVEAVTKQVARLQHTSNLYYTVPQVGVAEKIVEKSGLKKVFFCNSGAEANECAVKIARKYSFDKYSNGRNKIITLKNSFHGRTVTTLSATGQDVFHNYFFPFTDGFDYAVANDYQDTVSKLDDSVCAVLLELVQGEGGVVPLDNDYVKEIYAYCRDKDILFMVDEVQTGIARTGTLFCFEQYGILPDVLTLAKGLGGGLPIGACVVGERAADVLTSATHGTTFGANPVCCAAAECVLNKIDDGFLKAVRKKGEYMFSAVKQMPGVSQVRGLGMMIGIELESGDPKPVVSECLNNGLLVLTAKKSLRLLPPLNISFEELERGIAVLGESLTKLFAPKQ